MTGARASGGRPRVVVTRPAHQAAELVAAFRAAGFPTELLPLLEVVPPADAQPFDRAVAGLGDFHWVALTSANAVAPLADRLMGGWPHGTRLAVVGPATARAAREVGLPVDLEAEQAQAEGLVAALAGTVSGRRVLLPQAADARPALERGLATAGARVTAVVAYDKRLPADASSRARELFNREIGWVTVTSPRIVRHLVPLLDEALGPGWPKRRDELRAASIGPITSAELRRQGFEPAAEAEEPSDADLVAAVRETL